MSPRADSSMLAASGASIVRSRTSGFGLNPETWDRDSISPGNYDRPEDFSIFRENCQSEFHLQRHSDIRTIWKD